MGKYSMRQSSSPCPIYGRGSFGRKDCKRHRKPKKLSAMQSRVGSRAKIYGCCFSVKVTAFLWGEVACTILIGIPCASKLAIGYAPASKDKAISAKPLQ